jgi:hypothetical protein
MLKAAGQTPIPVPGRILFRALEHASFEDDDTLQAKWAALLANAATGPHSRVLPAYVDILRQLMPIQAQIVDWMYDALQVKPRVPDWTDVHREELQPHFGLSDGDYALFMSDLHRLQLIDGRRRVMTLGEEKAGPRVLQTTESQYHTIALTPLGINFVQACRPPARKAGRKRKQSTRRRNPKRSAPSG